jgi:dTMP kinase
MAVWPAELLHIDFGAHEGPGTLIIVEGFDGCGKSTFVRALRNHLTFLGYTVCQTRLPTTSLRRSQMFQLFARQKRDDLVDALALQVLHASDRIQNCRKFITPQLRRGAIVIADRYICASVSTLLSWGLPVDGWFRELCQQVVAPDLALFMHAPAEVVIARIHQRPRERHVVLDHHKVEEALQLNLAIAKANKMRVLDTSSLTVDQCIQAIKDDLARLLPAYR